jgi:hypothetical protein
MEYGMHYRMGIILMIFITMACSAGCADPLARTPETPATPAPAVSPIPESTSATVPVSDMALQLTDIPADYILRDRSVMISPEVSQLTRDLGWTRGYFVTFDRTGRIKSDQTRIRQVIAIFPPENMKKVFTLEKMDLEEGMTTPADPNEIPFPVIGDQSIAYRLTNTPATGQVTYIVIFTKKNVYERMTMSGTSTDYETFKDVVLKAAAKIR